MSQHHTLKFANISTTLRLSFFKDGQWHCAELDSAPQGLVFNGRGISINLQLAEDSPGYRYQLRVEADFDTRVRLALELSEVEQPLHLIPCNVHGDNHLTLTGPGEYPHLTDQHPDDLFCAPLWELRADRAALPVSILCHNGGAVAPDYSMTSRSTGASPSHSGTRCR
jgi:hypothetical protein